MAEGQLQIRQVRSAIGAKPKHRGTLRALGLGRIGKTSLLPDRPEIRGMVASVTHLVEVKETGSVAPPSSDGPVGPASSTAKSDVKAAPRARKATS